ncbi:rhodanese-like domain-containing protein [Sabulicella glaciei]|uniref:Rhodanese-like domain-containing protein n=1 Tax=Sabulicella glaciei TaxID=2984948 RepID=A0ABT3P182_9PROT|nr:rhodanese-like domain-containing protein [Roseococcus sp. MDT2-1-1]MCW8087519.1 rhodanese-like domain-containing protein [Roseococcus sp. MDT2-1-1]
MPNPVTEVLPVGPAEMRAHLSRRLALETDCADVFAALRDAATKREPPDFVVLDVRGRAAYAEGHVPGSVSLPHRDITAERLAAWPKETVFVTYCAGPHCNGADRGALRIAEAGRKVKTMPGGMTGWVDEGLPLAAGREPGSILSGL